MYGITTIVPRLLNFLLVTLHSGVLLTSDYGIMSKIFAWVGIFLAILTYGMETSYFRFASKSNHPERVFSTTSIMVGFTSTLFILFIYIFSVQVSSFLDLEGFENYVLMMGTVVAFDAFTSIPFAKLRLEGKSMRFMVVKFVNVGINIGLNVFFLWYCPRLTVLNPNSFILSFYDASFGVGYVFLCNLIASVSSVLLMIDQFVGLRFDFDKGLSKKMLKYGFPILLVSLSGMLSMQSDKILMTYLLPNNIDADSQLGIYSACLKLTVILALFTQAFRYAFEPFFFSQGKGNDKKDLYADVLKYFLVFCLLVFLGVNAYLDLFKNLVSSSYHDGLKIVPIAMMANIFSGAYYSLSLWYKITDKTKYGAYLAIGGAFITILMNVILVPMIGISGAAYAMLISWMSMCIASYILMKKHYPIDYEIKKIAFYFIIALFLFYLIERSQSLFTIQGFVVRNIILIAFILVVFLGEKKSFLKKYIARK